MADERNFRSTYYEKVGCRGVEERKSLEILLKEKPLNLTKLTQFCIRFTVPKIHRTVLWNSLLGKGNAGWHGLKGRDVLDGTLFLPSGVTPVYDKSREYVMEQRVAVYNDLLKALKIMRIVDETTPTSRVLYAMWLLEKKQLYLGRDITVSVQERQKRTFG